MGIAQSELPFMETPIFCDDVWFSALKLAAEEGLKPWTPAAAQAPGVGTKTVHSVVHHAHGALSPTFG